MLLVTRAVALLLVVLDGDGWLRGLLLVVLDVIIILRPEGDGPNEKIPNSLVKNVQ